MHPYFSSMIAQGNARRKRNAEIRNACGWVAAGIIMILAVMLPFIIPTSWITF